MVFLGGSAVKNPSAMQKPQETWVQSLGGEDPLEEGMTMHSSILAWRFSMDRGADGLLSLGSQSRKGALAKSKNRKRTSPL